MKSYSEVEKKKKSLAIQCLNTEYKGKKYSFLSKLYLNDFKISTEIFFLPLFSLEFGENFNLSFQSHCKKIQKKEFLLLIRNKEMIKKQKKKIISVK